MKTSIQIGKVMGIPIKIHISFLLVLVLFPVVFSSDAEFGFADVASAQLRYALALTLTILLFSCVLLHELGHSWVAMRYGIGIRSITLILLGGIAAMEEVPRDPRAEMRISIAGPLVSLTIGVLCYLAYLGLGIYDIVQISTISYISRFLWSISYINIILFVFNLIPAFPMDGGRVLRAWYAGRMPYLRATRKAVHIGKMFAIVMGVLGLFASIWLILIAFFIYIGASEEEKYAEVSVTLEGISVMDLMTREIAYVQDNLTISELLRLMFEKKHLGYPVVDQFTGKIVGIVTFTDIRSVPMSEHGNVLVRDVMVKNVIFIPEDADAMDALKSMSTENVGQLLVQDRGSITGIVSRTDLTRSIEVLGYHER
ncbi:MAG: CBS domain-containing protein [Methanosarcinales archaeon]|nr:CBS domain-containing protein [Methanosarcinales archaeon]